MDNASAAILGDIFGASISIGVGALTVQFMTEYLASFKPAFGTVFFASFIGYIASYAIGFIVGLAVISSGDKVTATVTLLTFVIGFFAQAACYSFMLKSPEGVALDYGRACIISLVQVTVTFLLIAIIRVVLA